MPDVILLDVGLPGDVRGYDLIAPLRAIPTLDRVPIVAVTSYAMGGDREQALAAGCNGYIEKPIDPEIFVTQIEQIMARTAHGGL
jgi:two-component system cell cycle response regulator DivK